VQILFEITFLAACIAIAAAPIFGALPRIRSADRGVFAVTWMVWIVVWGGAAVATALNYIVFTPVNLRLAALFGGQVAVGVILFLVWPRLRRAIREISLHWLVGWQTARVIGGFFLIGSAFGVVSMPFAAIAGIGDMAVGVAAWWTVHKMRARPDEAARYAMRHMRMGLTDFAVAISTAIVTQALIGWPYVLIPLFLVPMAVLAHLAVWDRVARDQLR
jgi:hypothetical protein